MVNFQFPRLKMNLLPILVFAVEARYVRVLTAQSYR